MMLTVKRGSFFGKLFLFLFILILIAVAFVLITKGYLVYNWIVGNDISVSLSSDSSYLSLQKGESGKVIFNAKVTANPFCSVECSYSFRDLSSSREIDSSTFEMKLLEPISREYSITENTEGVGQSLYLFSMQCKGIKSTLCHTSGESRGRNILLVVDYNLSSEEEAVKASTRSSILNLVVEQRKFSSYASSFSEIKSSLSTIMSQDYLNEKSLDISSYLSQLDLHINKSLDLWDNWELNEAQQEIALAQNSLFSLEKEALELNSSVSGNVSMYNSLIENIYLIQNYLENYSSLRFQSDISKKIESYALDFNSIVDKFNSTSLTSTNDKTLILLDKVSSISYEESNSSDTTPSFSLKKASFSPITIPIYGYSSEFVLPDPAPRCCVGGKCEKCCDSSCYSDVSKFPVIFIHGHDFSSSVSSEFSLDVFEGIQEMLEKEGYLNAGPLLIGSTSSGPIWGKSSSPVSVRASYYFDILKSEGLTTTIQTKTDNIDTYALRLKDIINIVKAETNREKVIIVSHSMGGLVARRYLGIFGDSDVYKLVMIGTPNHGISGTTSRYCSVLGASLECSDMDSGSLFINKLNNAKIPTMPVHNIIGIGCDTDGEDGDGIVKNSSAYLSFAQNYYVSGTCDSSFTYLHNELLNPYKYPEVYSIINKSIQSSHNSFI